MFREFVNALVEKEDIYLKASPGKKKLKAHQKMINYIEEFCNKMTEKYLISAAGDTTKRRKSAGAEVVKVNTVCGSESPACGSESDVPDSLLCCFQFSGQSVQSTFCI